jgi:hypothetical protein
MHHPVEACRARVLHVACPRRLQQTTVKTLILGRIIRLHVLALN